MRRSFVFVRLLAAFVSRNHPLPPPVPHVLEVVVTFFRRTFRGSFTDTVGLGYYQVICVRLVGIPQDVLFSLLGGLLDCTYTEIRFWGNVATGLGLLNSWGNGAKVKRPPTLCLAVRPHERLLLALSAPPG